ncbi:MAG TPA: hypothetical protein VGV60_06710 [Candidatus Polarisedimenticolia bacterium]|nr:hypothetical protein [Candidatus Polarisedimenticolia bacterium]
MRHRNSWRNPPGASGRVRSRGVFIGTLAETGAPLRLNPDLFSTHLEIVGSPGTGKTREQMWLFSQVARVPKATVIAINPKGSSGEELRDWVIGHGLAKRLIWFDPGEEGDHVLGWNPLQPNGLPIATHAKATREAIRASWGQSDFDQTAQLARFLYLALAVTRELELTLVEALAVLDPGSPLRREILPQLRDPFVRASLTRLDSYPLALQEQLVASTVARLESFVLDPAIRFILARRSNCLRIADVVDQGRIMVVNMPVYAPLRADDVRLLGRLLINDILSYVFSRPKEARTPVYLLIDEVQMLATEDLAVACEAGRELNLNCILGHQYPEQLRTEASDRLYHAVMNCCRTKMVFGGLSTEQLDTITREVTIEQYDPKAVKDELYALEIEPVEAVRVVRTFSSTESTSRGHSHGRGEATSDGVTRGGFRAYGKTKGRSESESQMTSSAHAAGYQAVMGTGQVVMPDGQIVSTNSHDGSGVSSASIAGSATARGSATSESESVQHGRSVAQTKVSQVSTNESESEAESTSSGSAFSIIPWNACIKRLRVASRTFWTEAEYLTEQLKKIKGLPKAHFLLKTPSSPAVVVRAPYVPTPVIGKIRRQQALALVYAQPFYARRDEISADEQRSLPKSASTEAVVIRKAESVTGVRLRPPFKKTVGILRAKTTR